MSDDDANHSAFQFSFISSDFANAIHFILYYIEIDLMLGPARVIITKTRAGGST